MLTLSMHAAGDVVVNGVQTPDLHVALWMSGARGIYQQIVAGATLQTLPVAPDCGVYIFVMPPSGYVAFDFDMFDIQDR